MNCVKYIPSEEAVYGESCLLDTYFNLDEDKIAEELSNHDVNLDLNEEIMDNNMHKHQEYEILHVIPGKKISILHNPSELKRARSKTKKLRKILRFYNVE